MRSGTHSENGFDESIRYYRNARELLARCKVRDDLYEDMKPVQEAFGTAWLAIDKAVKAALLEKGLTWKQIPKSWEALQAKLVRHLAVRNGKLTKLVSAAYEMIHKEGYYYGAYRTAATAKGAFDVARRVIETLSSHGGCGTPPCRPTTQRPHDHPIRRPRSGAEGTTMGGRTRRGAGRKIA